MLWDLLQAEAHTHDPTACFNARYGYMIYTV